MLFDFEPSGVNDTYLRIMRAGVSCILAPTETWNGLVRVNYLVAASAGGGEPHMVFRCMDVGWDDGRFYWRGRAAPVLVSSGMVDLLVSRALLSDDEAETLAFGIAGAGDGNAADRTLMLRAAIKGCTFTPLYEERRDIFAEPAPPRVTGFVLRTLSDPHGFVLETRDGLPVLDAAARAALRRHVTEG